MIKNELLEIVRQNIQKPDNLLQIHPDLYYNLIDKKIIVSDSVSESAEVISEIKKRLSSQSRLRLIINPTLDCNLRCWYCYETHLKGSTISHETATSIIKFVKEKVKNPTLSTVDLAFFGGEPLMRAKDCVIPLSDAIKNICYKHNKHFTLHFTTNGILLTNQVIDKISEIYYDTNFQIAFDGDRNLHNSIKKLPYNRSAYDCVLENIDYGLTKNLKFNIRCNYSDDNIDSFKNLINDIAKLPHIDYSLIHISLQKVWQVDSSLKLRNKVMNIQNYAREKGFNCMMEGASYIVSHCYADFENSYIINYNGDIFKCTARNFEPKNRIGFLNNSGQIIFENPKLSNIDLRFKEDCNDCKLLPLCTICIQKHIECRHYGKCPYGNIPENDKSNQILNRFKEMYREYI